MPVSHGPVADKTKILRSKLKMLPLLFTFSLNVSLKSYFDRKGQYLNYAILTVFLLYIGQIDILSDCWFLKMCELLTGAELCALLKLYIIFILLISSTFCLSLWFSG